MDILLVTATAMEMRAVLSGVSAAGGAGGEVFRLGRCRLHPLICGVGPVNAAFALGRRLGLAGSPDARPFFSAVLNMGIAGTYDQDRLPVGSVAAASAEIWPEYGLAGAGQVDAVGLGFAQAVYRGGRIVERVELAPQEALGSLGIGWHTPPLDCPAVTVAGCSADPERARSLRERTQGLMENMEGFALALGCLHYENGLGVPGVDGSLGIGPSGAKTAEHVSGGEPRVLPALPFVEIRSISNVAGCRPPKGWDMPGALAALSRTAKELFA